MSDVMARTPSGPLPPQMLPVLLGRPVVLIVSVFFRGVAPVPVRFTACPGQASMPASGSRVHVDEQPSPLTRFPSSHCSGGLTKVSPHPVGTTTTSIVKRPKFGVTFRPSTIR